MAGSRAGALARPSDLTQARVPTRLLPAGRTALCPRCFQLSRATDLSSPPPPCVPVQPLQGHRAGWPQVPFTGLSATGTDSLKRHREGLECSQALQEALLADRQTGTQQRAALAGQREAGHSHRAHGLWGTRRKEQNVPLLYLYSSVLWWVGD